MTSDGEMILRRRAQPAVRSFLSDINKRGDAVQKRRKFLTNLLAVTGLSAAEMLVNAASADASAIEKNGSAHAALVDIQREIYNIGRDHMKPGANSAVMRARALATWRDANALRNMRHRRATTLRRAVTTEAQAAGLVAQFFGDRGQTDQANAWYKHATALDSDAETASWLFSCWAWVPLYEGVTFVAQRLAHKGATLSNRYSPDRVMFGYDQLARAHALDGSYARARQALSTANTGNIIRSGEHERAKPNLLFFTDAQHYQYMADTLSMLAFGDQAANSDRERALMFVETALECEYPPNGINRVLIELARARATASGRTADPDGATEYAVKAIRDSSLDDRTSQVVKGKARQLATDLGGRFHARSVREFNSYVSALNTAG